MLVPPPGRFPARDEPAERGVRQLFWARVLAPAVVVVTCREDLEGASLHNYVRDTDNRAPRALVAECGGRVCALNNRTAAAERRARVDELLARVERLARDPPGAPFTNAVYRLAGTLATRPLTTGCGRGPSGWRPAPGGGSGGGAGWRGRCRRLGALLLLGLLWRLGPKALQEVSPHLTWVKVP